VLVNTLWAASGGHTVNVNVAGIKAKCKVMSQLRKPATLRHGFNKLLRQGHARC
jgi:hypothetical protein